MADTTKRDKGTLLHSLVDQYIKTGQWDTASVPVGWSEVHAWAKHCAIYMDNVVRPAAAWVLSEVAFEVRWDAMANGTPGCANVLHDVVEREYPEREGWMNGTADLIYRKHDGTLVVADWKTGGSLGSSEQLRSLLAAFVWASDTEAGLMGGPFEVHTLSVTETGVWPKPEYITWEDLEQHAVDMAGALHGPVTTKMGPHCTALYCPHLAFCPSVTESVMEFSGGSNASGPGPALVPADRLKYRMTTRPRSHEEAGYVMSRLSAAKRQIAYTEEALKNYCHNGGKVLSGGYEWSKKNDGFRWRKA
jgi:hypothetical protein